MTQFVLVELGGLNHVGVKARFLCNVDLDLSADTTCLGVGPHEVVKLLQRIGVWTRADVKHEGKLRLDVLADALEEPLVRVDLAVVAVLDAEHEVDAAPLQDVLLNPEVPRRHLEAVQQV